jgi:hypothetical protein
MDVEEKRRHKLIQDGQVSATTTQQSNGRLKDVTVPVICSLVAGRTVGNFKEGPCSGIKNRCEPGDIAESRRDSDSQ